MRRTCSHHLRDLFYRLAYQDPVDHGYMIANFAWVLKTELACEDEQLQNIVAEFHNDHTNHVLAFAEQHRSNIRGLLTSVFTLTPELASLIFEYEASVIQIFLFNFDKLEF